jgi:hypothetical protein
VLLARAVVLARPAVLALGDRLAVVGLTAFLGAVFLGDRLAVVFLAVVFAVVLVIAISVAPQVRAPTFPIANFFPVSAQVREDASNS